MKIPLLFLPTKRSALVAAGIWAGSAVLLGAASAAKVMPVALKHRVEVVAPFSAPPARQGLDLTIEPGTAPPGNAREGVVIQRDEWASALDELKLALGQSPVIRPTEPVTQQRSATSQGPDPAFQLHARFGRVGGSYRVLLRLVQKNDGALVAASDGRGDEMQGAIATAVARVEKEMLRRPWRCQVAELIQHQIAIPFGRLDGLQAGQILTGFTLPGDVRSQSPVLSDLLLLRSGKKAGQYKVTRVTEELALLEQMPGATELEPGDVLEAPAVPLHDYPRSSPSTIWDRVYQE